MDMLQSMLAMGLRENWQAFLDINRLAGHSALLDSAMIFGANDLLFALPVALLLVWLLLARWSPYSRWLAARFGEDVAQSDRWLAQRALLTSFIGAGLALAFTILLGTLVYEPRPFVSHPTLAHKLVAHLADASFPSDHETVAMALTLALVVYLIWLLARVARERWNTQKQNANLESRGSAWLGRVAPALIAATLALLIAVVIGFSRVFVGVHYPLDIVGGALSGAAGDALAFGLIPLTQRVFRPIVRVAGALRLA